MNHRHTGTSQGLPRERDGIDRNPLVRSMMQIVWPAFLVAAIGTGLLFSVVDPLSVDVVIESLNGSREAAYTIGFLFLWVLLSIACGLTWILASSETRRARKGGTGRAL